MNLIEQTTGFGRKSTTVKLRGRFDIVTAPRIRKELLKIARRKNVRLLEINLADAQCVDGSCVAVLVEVLREVQLREASLRISGMGDGMKKMINLSRLEDLFADSIVQG
jgi:anti-anti-sigma factor